MKLIGIGRNYAAHIEELKKERPEDPVVFLMPDFTIYYTEERRPDLYRDPPGRGSGEARQQAERTY